MVSVKKLETVRMVEFDLVAQGVRK